MTTGFKDNVRPEQIDAGLPTYFQPRINTMAKKLIIEAAIPGWQPVQWWRDHGVTKLPPITIEEQADAIVECVKAGASVIHTHPRDPSTTRMLVHGVDLLIQILDRAFEKVDFITATHTWSWDFTKSHAVDYISYTRELLERGKGNKYCQSALVMTLGVFNTNNVVFEAAPTREGVAWLEANGVKPMYSIQAYSFKTFKELLFDSEVSKWKPHWLALQLGKHTDDQIYSDPWSYIQTISNLALIKEAMPDALLGIHPAGRNWLPVSVIALLYGTELIRVGLEDQFWLYPHKDDVSRKASDTVKLIADIARLLGREIATVDEARERLGMTLTSRL